MSLLCFDVAALLLVYLLLWSHAWLFHSSIMRSIVPSSSRVHPIFLLINAATNSLSSSLISGLFGGMGKVAWHHFSSRLLVSPQIPFALQTGASYFHFISGSLLCFCVLLPLFLFHSLTTACFMSVSDTFSLITTFIVAGVYINIDNHMLLLAWVWSFAIDLICCGISWFFIFYILVRNFLASLITLHAIGVMFNKSIISSSPLSVIPI